MSQKSTTKIRKPLQAQECTDLSATMPPSRYDAARCCCPISQLHVEKRMQCLGETSEAGSDNDLIEHTESWTNASSALRTVFLVHVPHEAKRQLDKSNGCNEKSVLLGGRLFSQMPKSHSSVKKGHAKRITVLVWSSGEARFFAPAPLPLPPRILTGGGLPDPHGRRAGKKNPP